MTSWISRLAYSSCLCSTPHTSRRELAPRAACSGGGGGSQPWLQHTLPGRPVHLNPSGAGQDGGSDGAEQAGDEGDQAQLGWRVRGGGVHGPAISPISLSVHVSAAVHLLYTKYYIIKYLRSSSPKLPVYGKRRKSHMKPNTAGVCQRLTETVKRSSSMATLHPPSPPGSEHSTAHHSTTC